MSLNNRLSIHKIAFLIGFGADSIGGLLGLCTSSSPLFMIGVITLYGFASSYWLATSSKRSTADGITIGLAATGLYLASLTAHGNPFETQNFGSGFFHALFVGPALMSGLLAAVLGARRRTWTTSVPLRFMQGTVAGGMLCVLHILCVGMLSASLYTLPFASAWGFICYPIALGAASTVYLPIMHNLVTDESENVLETSFNAAATAWVDKLTIAKSGVILFVLMVLAGIGWAGIFR